MNENISEENLPRQGYYKSHELEFGRNVVNGERKRMHIPSSVFKNHYTFKHLGPIQGEQ